MNVICIMGRLTADPELRHTASQVPVTSFTLAVDRAFQQKGSERQADFIPVVAWRNTAEFICRYFRKGQKIALKGELQTRRYTDKEGNKRTAYEVVADQVYFAESKAAKPSADVSAPEYDGPPAFSNAGAGDFEEITDDSVELPF